MHSTESILAIDQGTTSSRAMLFNKHGHCISKAQKNITQIFPASDWVEHDPMEIWQSQLDVIIECVEHADSMIKGIGITNQRETVVLWHKESGRPIYNAIVWQDRRTSQKCTDLKSEGWETTIHKKTGLVIDPYFTALKIQWILNHVDGARNLAKEGLLLVGTIDTWLVWNLTKGRCHVTDVSNASRTQLYNINTLQWDEELLTLFDIPRSILPEVKSSSQIYGHVSIEGPIHNIPIAGIAGDQQAALFGQRCFENGLLKSTYGTGCFALMNIGQAPLFSKNNLLTTIAWQIDGTTTYALEGSVFMGGAVTEWLKCEMKMGESEQEVATLADSVKDTNGVYFVPSFTGMGAPYWDTQARGTIFGITRSTTDAHIAKAGMHAIAFQCMDLFKAMSLDANGEIKEIRVDGGASSNDALMQFQSDISDVKIVRPVEIEATALGVAFLAGLAVGFWNSIEELNAIAIKTTDFITDENNEEKKKEIVAWNRAVESVRYWSKIKK